MTSLPAVAAFDPHLEAGRRPPPWAGGPGAETERLQRSIGAVDVAFRADAGRTGLIRAYQSGCGRLRFPRQHEVPMPTGVVINTAGGLTGGDRFAVSASLGAGAQAVLTSQAAEKVYRSAGGVAELTIALEAGPGAALHWLPQETILFDGGALSRRIDARLATDATLTAAELVVFGRTAMGERVETGLLADRWRIFRDGRLVFADANRLAGPVHRLLARPATAAGAAAVALVVHVGPGAEARLDAARAGLAQASDVEAGVSAFDGLLVARMVAPSGGPLRAAALMMMDILRDGLPAPRPWQT